jgi:hypothetical protein
MASAAVGADEMDNRAGRALIFIASLDPALE